VSEDAGIEPRKVATGALAVRRSNYSARSHPDFARYHTNKYGITNVEYDDLVLKAEETGLSVALV
jgi:hypothetical protein